MKGELEINVTLPIDENTTFPIKILTDGKAKEMVLKALEDVRAEIEAMYGVTDFCDGSIRIDKYEVLASIEQKIAEVTKNE